MKRRQIELLEAPETIQERARTDRHEVVHLEGEHGGPREPPRLAGGITASTTKKTATRGSQCFAKKGWRKGRVLFRLLPTGIVLAISPPPKITVTTVNLWVSRNTPLLTWIHDGVRTKRVGFPFFGCPCPTSCLV